MIISLLTKDNDKRLNKKALSDYTKDKLCRLNEVIQVKAERKESRQVG